MPYYEGKCENCGQPYRLFRATTQAPPRFCSRACHRATQLPSVSKCCEQCGETFTVIGAIAERSRFCSYACYWAAGGPRDNSPFRPNPNSRQRKRVYVGRVDGKPRYIPRSHWVWLQHHPNDPILPGQHIHHKDENPLNDDIANLEKLWRDDHERLHAERNTLPPRTCPVCGGEFKPKNGSQRSCSRACAWEIRKADSGER